MGQAFAICLMIGGMMFCCGAGRLEHAPTTQVADKIADVFAPAPLDQQQIDGLLGQRMRINLEERLLRVDEEAILEGFEHRPGKQAWLGEHAGKFLHAAANEWAYNGDEKLKALMDRVARRLIAAQMPDGYLGTYTDDKRWTEWDVWVHKYDLLGLVRYYEVTGDRAALDASKKIGDLLCQTFGPGVGQRDIIKSGEHMGMAATSVLEPMCSLYRYTGDAKYLDFCRYIVRAYDHEGGPAIIKNISKTGRVFGTANNKAYEMLSNFVGLLELYRITGEKPFLDVAQRAWKDIVNNRLYITGTTSNHEYFGDDHVLPATVDAHVGEGCVTVTWLQLNWHLLRLTGEAKYADEIERTVYNHLLAAQNPTSGDVCYFTPLIGKRDPGHEINCCLSSVPRGIAMIPQLVWGSRGDAIQVNLYTAGNARIGDMQIKSETTYPADGKVILSIKTGKAKTFTLLLRVPSWCESFEARVAEETYRGAPGKFLEIDRQWSDDDRVEIEMAMSIRKFDGGKTYPNHAAIQRGPQVLAAEVADNPRIELSRVALSAINRLNSIRDNGTPQYRVGGLKLTPFADATDCRVWIPLTK